MRHMPMPPRIGACLTTSPKMNEQRDPGPIEWIYDAADQAYILIDGPCRSRAWKTPNGLWAAVVSCHGDSVTAYDFPLPAMHKPGTRCT